MSQALAAGCQSGNLRGMAVYVAHALDHGAVTDEVYEEKSCLISSTKRTRDPRQRPRES